MLGKLSKNLSAQYNRIVTAYQWCVVSCVYAIFFCTFIDSQTSWPPPSQFWRLRRSVLTVRRSLVTSKIWSQTIILR